MTFKKNKQTNKQNTTNKLARRNTISGKPSIHIVASEVRNPKFPGANQLVGYLQVWPGEDLNSGLTRTNPTSG